MSKELIERIMDYTSRHRRTAPQVCDILTACKQRIEEMQSDINGWLVIKGNMTKHQQELEQENSRLKGRVEAEAQSGMQSLRTQENLFGAKLDALQAQLEAAEGVLREYSSIDDPGHLDRRWISKRAADYFRTKEGKEKA